MANTKHKANGSKKLNGTVSQQKKPLLRSGKTREEMKSQVVSTDPTRDYKHSQFGFYGELYVQQLPLWRLWTGRMMLTSDPIVNFSLNIRNAALMPAQVDITAKNPQVEQWVRDQWDFLWTQHRSKLVSAKKWGFAPLQIDWKNKDGLLHIKGVKDFAPEDARALEQSGRLCGQRIKGNPVYFPQALWLTYAAEFGSPYGYGCLRRSYPAWYEKWMDRGAKRLLQLRMIKDAYIGDIFWYPPNLLIDLPDGTQMSWKDLMRELGENRLSGGALTMPNVYDNGGNKLTDYTPPQDTGSASQIFEWNDSCDEGILRGADVPMEVVQAADTGSGYSGRSIPFLVVLSNCTQEFTEIVQRVEEQVLRPAAWLNWGGDPEFTIRARSLVESFSQDTSGSAMGGSAIGTQAGAPLPQEVQQGGGQQFSEDKLHWESTGVARHPHLADSPHGMVHIDKLIVTHGRNQRPAKPVDRKAPYNPIVIDHKGEIQDGHHRYYALHDKGYHGDVPVVVYGGGNHSKLGLKPVDTVKQFSEKVGKVLRIPLSKIKTAQLRSELNKGRVEHYRDKIRSGAKIDPVTVVRNQETGNYHMTDGHHRHEAHKKEKRTHIRAKVDSELPSTRDTNLYIREARFQFAEQSPLNYVQSRHPNVTLKLDHRNQGLTNLDYIGVHPRHQGKGYAHAAMKDLAETADRHGVTLRLTPDESYGSDKSRLRKFYSKHGFKSRGLPSGSMQREPITQHEEEHKFSSTQFNIEGDIAQKMRLLGERIPSEDLAEDGREANPHITVKYGLHTNNPEDVGKVVRGMSPVAVRIGKCSVFPAKEETVQRGGAGHDVVKLEVEGEGIRDLNEVICAGCEHTDTFPTYIPHITIAYVKPGLGQYWANKLNELEGEVLAFNRLVFSDKERNHTSIPLTGTEVRFAESEDVARLRRLVRRGTSPTIKAAIARMREMKDSPMTPGTLAGILEREIRALQPSLLRETTKQLYGYTLKGMAEVIGALPRYVTDDLVGEPTPPPSLPEVIGPGEGTGVVDFPIMRDALKTLSTSPAAAGIDYRDTAAKVKEGAFAITTDLGDKAVADVQTVLTETLSEGRNVPQFIEAVTDKLEKHSLSDAHLENIFRTNTATYTSEGKKKALSHPVVSDAFPYALYQATEDTRVRKEHFALEKLGLNGTAVYRINDPTFLKFRPPWAYQCRCNWVPITVEQAAKLGVKEAIMWKERAEAAAKEKGGSWHQYIQVSAPQTQEFVTPPDFEPDPEFHK